MNNKSHSRFALINKTDIETALTDGKIDENDILITKDTGEFILISSDHELKPITSRTYTYNSVEEALKVLNEREDTYVGQVVAIWDGKQYAGYVVNYRNGKYQTDPLAAPEIHLDYYDVKTLTKAEYDALSDEEKNNGNIYLVTDENGYPAENIEIVIDSIYCRLFVNPCTHVAMLSVDTDAIRTVGSADKINYGIIPTAYRPNVDVGFVCATGTNRSIVAGCTVGKDGNITMTVTGRITVAGLHGSCTWLYI